MDNKRNKELGGTLRQQRTSKSMTVAELAAKSGISQSHLTRIERGERFPSARALRKMAKPLGFDEGELFMLAGFLSQKPPAEAENVEVRVAVKLDPHVASILSQESTNIQRAVIGILSILKNLSQNITKES